MPTLLELRNAAKQRGDFVNSSFITDAEWNGLINASARELHDLLVEVSEDYALEMAEATADGSADHLTLPSDFYKLRGVDEKIDGQWLPLRKFSLMRRHTNQDAHAARRRYRLSGVYLWLDNTPPASTLFRIWYVPKLAALAADEDVFDDVQGWSDFVVADAARKALAKEESDTAPIEREILGIRQRIKDASANRDQGEPTTVTDVYAAEIGDLEP